MITGVDLASYQGAPDFDRLRSGGVAFAITKVTEGLGYKFPGFPRNRSEAARVGMVPGMYHFARGNNPGDEARFFLSAIGALQPGEILALDFEIALPDPVGWSAQWVQTIRDSTGVIPFIYLNKSTVTKFDWSRLRDCGLWLASYDKTQTIPTGLNVWGSPAIKQYDDAGQMPGINGKVDLNVFNGPIEALQRYGKSAPPIQPQPGWDSLPSLNYGDNGDGVASLQRFLNGYPWNPPLPLLPITGNYLDQTANVLRRAQALMGVVGGDGRNIGPQTKQALWARGWRG